MWQAMQFSSVSAVIKDTPCGLPSCNHPLQAYLALLIRMRASSAVYFSGTPDDTSSCNLWALICNTYK